MQTGSQLYFLRKTIGNNAKHLQTGSIGHVSVNELDVFCDDDSDLFLMIWPSKPGSLADGLRFCVFRSSKSVAD